jgi:hypothetical protein
MRLPFRWPGKWGSFLLGVFLIAWGLMKLISVLQFTGSDVVLALLGVAAGILILLER